MRVRWTPAIVALCFATHCQPQKPPAPDAGPLARLHEDWCIQRPPPQPEPGTGQGAPEYPAEFAVCLYEPERTKLVLYVSSLRAWSEQMYATYGCEL